MDSVFQEADEALKAGKGARRRGKGERTPPQNPIQQRETPRGTLRQFLASPQEHSRINIKM